MMRSTAEKFDWQGYVNLYDFFEKSAVQYAEHPFLYYMSRTYTYQDIFYMIQDTAIKLEKDYGVKKGTCIALCMPNCPYYVVYYYAALRLGAVIVNVNPLYTAQDMLYIFRDACVEVVVTVDSKEVFGKVARAMREEERIVKKIVCALGDDMPFIKRFLYYGLGLGAWHRKVRHAGFDTHTNNNASNNGCLCTASIVLTVDDTALLQYTSGTTGRPKAAALTHGNLLANIIQINSHFAVLRPGEECFMGVLPFFHVFSMTTVLNLAVCVGGAIVLMLKFNHKALVQGIRRYGVTVFPSVPTIFAKLSHAYGDKLASFCESLLYIISGGAPLPLTVKHAFEKHTKKIIKEGYGLTETSPVLACNPVVGDGKDGSVGLIFPYTDISIRDINNDMQVCHYPEEGEICVKGPQVMRGYVGAAAVGAHVMTADGYFKTGDTGYVDQDGYLYVVDRIKDMIITNGYCVYPRRIEDAIRLYPAVHEVAVIGVADEKYGEVSKAFIVCRKGMIFNKEELDMILQNNLSPLERPRHVVCVDSIPLNFLGKPDKKLLKKQI